MPWSATRTRLDGDSAAVPLTDKHASSRHSRSHLPGATQSRLNTLFAALLPGVSSSVSLSSTSATVCTYRDLQPRPSVDRGFVMGYTAYCVGFVILSGYHIMQIRAGLDEKGRSSGGYLPATLLTVLTSHAPLILGAATLAIVTGILWLRALRAYLMPTVIAMTAFALPLAGATLGLVLVIVASMHLDHGTRDGGVEGHRMYGFLLGAGLVCLISAGSFVWYFWNNLLGADRAAPGTVPPDESMTSSGRRNGKSRGVTANSHLHAASAIMQLAGDVLRSNASIVSFSIGLMVLHVVWTAAWLWGFTQLFLSYSPSHLIGGGFSGELGGSGVTLWVWAALFLFTYFFQGAVLSQIERMTLTGLISTWYFRGHTVFGHGSVSSHGFAPSATTGGRHLADGTAPRPLSPLQSAIKMAVGSSFGSVLAAAVLLGLAQTARAVLVLSTWLERRLRHSLRMATAASSGSHESYNPAVRLLGLSGSALRTLIQAPLLYLAHTLLAKLEDVNAYTLIFCGITGLNYFSAAQTCSHFFRRHFVMGQTTARMVRAIFLAGIGVISAIAGSVVFYVVLTDGAHSQYGSPLAAADVAYAWIAGGIAFVLPFYLLRLVANLWQSAVSVMWVCYLIDLETGACHNPWVHRIFGSALG